MAHFAGETGHLAKHDDLDTYVAANPTPSSGTISARPAAGSVSAGQLYFATDDNSGTLYRVISGAWVQQAAPVNSYGPSNANLASATPAAVASAGAVGTGTTYARADHAHSGVTSVATRTGAVTLTAADIGAGTFPTGAFIYQAPTSGVALQLKAAVTTPSDIQQWQNSSGTTLSKVASDGSSQFVYSTVGSLAATIANTNLAVLASAATNKPLAVRGTTGQSANLQEWQDVAATVVGSMSPAGAFNTLGNITENGNRVYSAGNAPPYPVTSVATRTGAVTLTAADVAAGTFPAGTFTYPGSVSVSSILSAGHLDLSASSYSATAAGTGIGDKIALYLSGANGYGFGIQASTLVAYVPSGQKFAVRQASGTGAASSGSDVFSVSTAGNVIANGTLNTGSTLSENGNRVYSAGNAPPYPVTSVATRTGAVALTAADIGAGNFPGGSFYFQGVAGSIAASSGSVTMHYGEVGRTGYIEFFAANGTRQGYVGYSASTGTIDTGTLNYVAGTHTFTGAVQHQGSWAIPQSLNGVVSITIATSAGSGNASVSFGKTFSAVPSVSQTQSSLPGGTGNWIAKHIAATTTACTMYAYTASGTQASAAAANHDWIAEN